MTTLLSFWTPIYMIKDHMLMSKRRSVPVSHHTASITVSVVPGDGTVRSHCFSHCYRHSTIYDTNSNNIG